MHEHVQKNGLIKDYHLIYDKENRMYCIQIVEAQMQVDGPDQARGCSLSWVNQRFIFYYVDGAECKKKKDL